MEKLSRVKKYEELRKAIETDDTDEIQSEKLSEYANRLNEFDPIIFKKMEVKNEGHVPVREKKDVTSDFEVFNTDTFKNEYMDDFIKEVKQYNMDKGLLENENTEIDILSQLQSPKRKPRESYIQTLSDPEDEVAVKEDTVSQSKQEIAMQIQELLRDSEPEPQKGISVKKVDMNETRENALIVSRNHDELKRHQQENAENKEFQRKLSEETTQIRVQLSEYEEEITGLNRGIGKTQKLLNIVLALLVFALISIIGVMVYWVLKAGGKI